MERTAEIRLSLLVLISFFLHAILMLTVFLPPMRHFSLDRSDASDRALFGNRDIIVNINENEKKQISSATLLSEKDSAAKGYVTSERGDHWLNNSLEFRVKSGRARLGKAARESSAAGDRSELLIAENTEIVISLMRLDSGDVIGEEGGDDYTTIPDRNSFNRRNAIYYTNDGRFSFNTMKFKNFRYFKEMKDKIAAHWFPPLLANAAIGGYDPITRTYTPGRLRIMAIPSQEVKLYFTMNRNGDVLQVVIVDSLGNGPLDSSCVESIRLSRNFGTVPDDIKGAVIIIPFIFGYYVY